MGVFDRIFGNPPRQPAPTASSDDEQAIARYRYMLKTAPPEAIEQAHTEAFARLTPEQRRMVLEQLRAATPETERTDSTPVLADPKELARYATRAEIRQPGTLERTFGAMPGGVGIGGMRVRSRASHGHVHRRRFDPRRRRRRRRLRHGRHVRRLARFLPAAIGYAGTGARILSIQSANAPAIAALTSASVCPERAGTWKE